jgi:hypothetical protein
VETTSLLKNEEMTPRLGVLNFLLNKVPRQVFLIPRRLRGEKVPNVGPSHLICEMQIKR